jgi:hypothetical protein
MARGGAVTLGNDGTPTARTGISTFEVWDGDSWEDVVLDTRTLDINGDANEITVDLAGPLDLSADRAWAIGIADDPIIPGSVSVTIPSGVTGSEPAAVVGMLRYDTTTGKLRAVDGGVWVDAVGGGSGLAPGTVISSTLRWDGADWIENVTVLASGAGKLVLNGASYPWVQFQESGAPSGRVGYSTASGRTELVGTISNEEVAILSVPFSTVTLARFLPDGGTHLYYVNVDVFETVIGGWDVHPASGELAIGQIVGLGTDIDANLKLRGDSGGVQHYWDESALTAGIAQTNASGGFEENWLTMVDNGIVTVFADGDEKLRSASDANGAAEINKGGQWDEVWAGPITVGTGTTRANNTITDDADLTDSVSANRTYKVELFLEIENADATPDFQFQFSVPTSATFDGIAEHVDQDNTNNGIIGVNDVAAETITLQAAEPKYVFIRGTLVVAGTAGTFALGWAQANTDGLNLTNLRATSWMTLVDIT